MTGANGGSAEVNGNTRGEDGRDGGCTTTATGKNGDTTGDHLNERRNGTRRSMAIESSGRAAKTATSPAASSTATNKNGGTYNGSTTVTNMRSRTPAPAPTPPARSWIARSARDDDKN